jgi:hypothetical protein
MHQTMRLQMRAKEKDCALDEELRAVKAKLGM